MRIRGPADEVGIHRDRWGIAHVEATNDADAWFGLGFCHGQDRGFQLEILARGRTPAGPQPKAATPKATRRPGSLHLPLERWLRHAERLVAAIAEKIIGLHEGVDLRGSLVDH